MQANVSDLVTKFFERSNAIQAYWSFYSTAVLGLLAFFGTKKRDRLIASLLSVAFAGFAASNLDALRTVTRQRIVLKEMLTACTKLEPPQCGVALHELSDTVSPSSLTAVTYLHLTGDVFVFVGIWWLVLHREKS
jgi:hypothetical protein